MTHRSEWWFDHARVGLAASAREQGAADRIGDGIGCRMCDGIGEKIGYRIGDRKGDRISDRGGGGEVKGGASLRHRVRHG